MDQSFRLEYHPPIFQPSEGVYLPDVLLSISNFHNIQERQGHEFAEQAFLDNLWENCNVCTGI